MKQLIPYSMILLLTVSLMVGCGPDEEELQRQQQAEQQAHLDSLERVWQAEMEEMRQDSIRQARQDSIAQAEEQAAAGQAEREQRPSADIRFQNNGPFTVQVRSWRSEERAQEHADMWKSKGFDNAYVVSYGDESTGDIWFRVRMGNVASYSMAQRLKMLLQEEHNTESWVASSGN